MLKWLRPHHQVRTLGELNCEMLAARGIRGVMLDLDNTLAPWRCQEVANGVEAWVACLRQAGLQGCVVTNAWHARRVRPVAERLGLPFVTRAVKPLSGGYLRGMQILDTTPEITAMVGDMILTDVLGANRLGLYTVLVEPISPREAWPAAIFQRPLERVIGRAMNLT